jgi:hypothetical protein
MPEQTTLARAERRPYLTHPAGVPVWVGRILCGYTNALNTKRQDVLALLLRVRPYIAKILARSALHVMVHREARSQPMTGMGVRREKAALSSGCKSHPATAPAGSNRSSYGGNEMAEAFG